MKVIPFLLFLCFVLFSFSCSAGKFESLGSEDRTMYAIICRVANQLKNKYGLILIGEGGASDIDNKTTAFNAHFQINHLLSLEEARALIVDIAGVFLSVINNDKAHRPYLQYYPFDVKGLDIAIYITNKDRSTPLDPEICVIRLSKEMIRYSTKDPEKKYGYKSNIMETYEEAVEKVKQMNCENGEKKS